MSKKRAEPRHKPRPKLVLCGEFVGTYRRKLYYDGKLMLVPAALYAIVLRLALLTVVHGDRYFKSTELDLGGQCSRYLNRLNKEVLAPAGVPKLWENRVGGHGGYKLSRYVQLRFDLKELYDEPDASILCLVDQILAARVSRESLKQLDSQA